MKVRGGAAVLSAPWCLGGLLGLSPDQLGSLWGGLPNLGGGKKYHKGAAKKPRGAVAPGKPSPGRSNPNAQEQGHSLGPKSFSFRAPARWPHTRAEASLGDKPGSNLPPLPTWVCASSWA